LILVDVAIADSLLQGRIRPTRPYSFKPNKNSVFGNAAKRACARQERQGRLIIFRLKLGNTCERSDCDLWSPSWCCPPGAGATCLGQVCWLCSAV